MLHVERLLALRELRAIVDVRCVYEPLCGFNGRRCARGARLVMLAAYCGGVKTTPGI
jgi:hypothetical protein